MGSQSNLQFYRREFLAKAAFQLLNGRIFHFEEQMGFKILKQPFP